MNLASDKLPEIVRGTISSIRLLFPNRSLVVILAVGVVGLLGAICPSFGYDLSTPPKLCGNWPSDDETFAAIFHPQSTLPANLSDVPPYPGSKLIGIAGGVGLSVGQSSIAGTIVFCSDADVKTIFNYYKNFSSPLWKRSSMGSSYLPPEQNKWLPKHSKDMQVAYLDKETPPGGQTMLHIHLLEDAGKTVILMAETTTSTSDVEPSRYPRRPASGKTPPLGPPASDSSKPLDAPVITHIEFMDAQTGSSISPQAVPMGTDKTPCGELSSETQDHPKTIKVTIQGKNLQGASLSSNNIGTFGKQAIAFSDIQANIAGTEMSGVLSISAFARTGMTWLRLTNPSMKAATIEIHIAMNGTQYLKRTFRREKVCLFGEWPQVAPNREILILEQDIRSGLQATDKPGYKNLGMTVYVYEKQEWAVARAKYCVDSVRNYGCSKPTDNIIHVSADASGVGRLILHEAAHKLHFSYVGLYEYPVGGFTQKIVKSQFTQDWQQAAGDISPAACPYLPVIDLTHWSKGKDHEPHCGFAWAYGASHLTDSNLIKRFTEDIATMTEEIRFNPGFLYQGEALSDKRYKLKEAVLRKYGFL